MLIFRAGHAAYFTLLQESGADINFGPKQPADPQFPISQKQDAAVRGQT